MRRKSALVVVVIGAILGALALAMPRLLSIDRYRPKVISYLQEKLGKQVEIGRLTLKIFPVSLGIENFGVKNPAAFPSGYIVRVARAEAELDPRALLHGQVIVKSLVLDHPIIHLISDPDGPWNFENPQAKGSQRTFPLGLIYRVQIERGELIASNLLPSDAPGPVFFEAHDINSKLADVNLIGIISLSSSSASDGQGTVQAARLSFGTVDANNLTSKLQLHARKAFFTDIKAEIFGGPAIGDLSLDRAGKNAAFQSHVRFSGVSVERVLAAFENGRGKMTGRMEGELALAGEIEHTARPLAGIYGKGRITVRNGEVPTLQMNANLMRLVRFNDLGPAKEHPSAFNMISTDLELANLRITGKNIDIDGYGVDVDGSGSVSVDGFDEVNCQGVAQITTPQGFFTNTFARFAGGKLQNGKLSFPFQIGGTIANPSFSKAPPAHRLPAEASTGRSKIE
jgi:uncharacterized protein involved in outer membrane biogenesis